MAGCANGTLVAPATVFKGVCICCWEHGHEPKKCKEKQSLDMSDMQREAPAPCTQHDTAHIKKIGAWAAAPALKAYNSAYQKQCQCFTEIGTGAHILGACVLGLCLLWLHVLSPCVLGVWHTLTCTHMHSHALTHTRMHSHALALDRTHVCTLAPTCYIGHSHIGHNYTGHTYTGHTSYTGHSYTGHSYISHCMLYRP